MTAAVTKAGATAASAARRTSRVLDALAALGDRYVDEFLRPHWDIARLDADWFYALKFLLSRLYFQGRRDEVSEKFYRAMEACLDATFGKNPGSVLDDLWRRSELPHDAHWTGFDPERSRLWQSFDGGMGKRRDREMVLDALRYMHGLPKYNVLRHSLARIDAGTVVQHRAEIAALWGAGPKTSAFYLRDVVFLAGRRLAASDLLALQPIDTWVDQVRMLIDPSAPAGYDAAANWFVAHADAGYDPARLNAGAWYLGKHAFRISLALLSSADISKDDLLRLPVWSET